MKNTSLHEIFEDALLNGNPEDLKSMNLHLQYPDWQVQFREFSDIRQKISLAYKIKQEEEAFKSLTSQMSKEYFGESRKVKVLKPLISGSWLMRFAAVLVTVLCCITAVYFYSSSKLTNEAIYADFPLMENTVARSVKPDINGNEVKIAFADKNYNKVIKLLSQYDLADLGKPDYILMLGASFYHTRNYADAVTQYQLLIDFGSFYIQEGYQNMALCYIRSGQEMKAIEVLLEGIKNPDVTNKETLQEMLDRLNNPLRSVFRKN